MQPQCFGQCLPRFTGHPGGAPGGFCDDPQDAFYESEIARMKEEVARLRDTNKALNKELAEQETGDEEDEEEEKEEDSDEQDSQDGDEVVSPEQVNPVIDAEFGEDDDAQDREKLGEITRESSGNVTDKDLSRPSSTLSGVKAWAAGNVNSMVMAGSALGQTLPVRIAIYSIAGAAFCFVLLAHSFELGVEHDAGHSSSSSAASGDPAAVSEEGAHHRRLGGGASPMLINIAFVMTACGLTAFLTNMIKQPLILGYLIGGVLVGPIGLHIVEDWHAIDDISSLGLIFCLFMIGLELDVKQFFLMDRVTVVTGFLQFPICCICMYGIFSGLHGVGLFGVGEYTGLYLGTTCALSSTMIVVKLLEAKRDSERPNGRLSIGILIFQDIWAIVILALQPNVEHHEGLDFAKTIGLSLLLCVVSLCYAKFVMPAVLFYSAKSVELMLVLSLAWCFLVCSTAILPYLGLSMELAALIAGLSLAIFPYSTDFNTKIKYIRDFFLTIFFAGLGMLIPVPTIETLATAVLVSIIIILTRWLTIFMIVVAVGGGGRLGALASINLSQLSEFALVICSLGMKAGHIDEQTLTIIIWAFAILCAGSCPMINFNHKIYRFVNEQAKRLMANNIAALSNPDPGFDDGDDRDIVLLGFHRIAFMLINEFRNRNPSVLQRLHVIDFNKSIMPLLRKQGIKCTFGDYCSRSVLEEAHGGHPDTNGEHIFGGAHIYAPPKIVLSSIPDSLLQGTTNEAITKTAKDLWPTATLIATAENPQQARTLYDNGADYALRSAKLCAERLHELLTLHSTSGSELSNLFQQYKRKDRDTRSSFISRGHKM